MTSDVNPPGPPPFRQAQVAHTEERILTAADELFLAEGYLATTLAAVARVAARTVYVRFGTKAALFKRVIDVAIVGDTQPVNVLGREWAHTAFTAPTAAARITAFAAGGRQIMERTGALFAVAQPAAAVGAPDRRILAAGPGADPGCACRLLDPDGFRWPAGPGHRP